VSNISSPMRFSERISRSIYGPRLSACIIARVGKVPVVVVVRSQYTYFRENELLCYHEKRAGKVH